MRRQNINQTSQCFCGVTELLKFGIESMVR